MLSIAVEYPVASEDAITAAATEIHCNDDENEENRVLFENFENEGRN